MKGFGKGQGAAINKDGLHINGTIGRLFADSAAGHKDNCTDAAGKIELDANLLFKDHGKNGKDHDNQGNHLFPSRHIGKVLLLIIHGISHVLRFFRQETIPDTGKEGRTDQKNRKTDKAIFKETDFNTYILKRGFS